MARSEASLLPIEEFNRVSRFLVDHNRGVRQRRGTRTALASSLLRHGPVPQESVFDDLMGALIRSATRIEDLKHYIVTNRLIELFPRCGDGLS